jgi:hypothetical protein
MSSSQVEWLDKPGIPGSHLGTPIQALCAEYPGGVRRPAVSIELRRSNSRAPNWALRTVRRLRVMTDHPQCLPRRSTQRTRYATQITPRPTKRAPVVASIVRSNSKTRSWMRMMFLNLISNLNGLAVWTPKDPLSGVVFHEYMELMPQAAE